MRAPHQHFPALSPACPLLPPPQWCGADKSDLKRKPDPTPHWSEKKKKKKKKKRSNSFVVYSDDDSEPSFSDSDSIESGSDFEEDGWGYAPTSAATTTTSSTTTSTSATTANPLVLKASQTHVMTSSRDMFYQNHKVVIVSFGLISKLCKSNAIKPGHFKCVIVDESHMLKNPQAQRTKLLLPVIKVSTARSHPSFAPLVRTSRSHPSFAPLVRTPRSHSELFPVSIPSNPPPLGGQAPHPALGHAGVRSP